ncbi:MAG: NAD(P)H-hydrate dehydratase [Porphyromonadaceae bacterium]|nr:NAD(P)H-hydrate dehydratase [Porphyromonadaceae bacterium]
MKIFTTSQIRQIDLLTIKYEPISSIGLMERAADSLLKQIKHDFSTDRDVLIISGPGNYGGDGLALGRMLLQIGYDVKVILVQNGKISNDCKVNKERLIEYFPAAFSEQINKFTPPETSNQTIILDALFGSGLSRPLEGVYSDAVNWMNSVPNTVISIDIPSGLQGESVGIENIPIVKSNLTYTFQFPKLAFFFSENEKYVGKWEIVDIQLHPKAILEIESNYFYVEKADVQSILKPRNKFSHKGTFGHSLIWAGKKCMAGAAVLAAKAALRSGAGLVSVHSVEENRVILQTAVPEAIFLSEISDLKSFSSLAFGPGLGTDPETAEMLSEMLETIKIPCILDADALNIISQHKNFFDLIPPKSILTPHPKEFDRLFGESENSAERLRLAIKKAKEHDIYIVLKGADTIISTPEGKLFVNSTGNPGMSVGGSGDVLTGIIAGLFAQGYSPEESSVFGVFIHGLAGDLCLESESVESLLPSDVISNLGKAYHFIKN